MQKGNSKRADSYLSAKEAADFLGVKVSTIYAWVHQRRLLYRKHGSLLKFSQNYLEMYSKMHERQPLD